MDKIIKFIGYEDYFFIVKKDSIYNTTSKMELHSLNSECYLSCGFLNILTYLIKFRLDI